MCAKILDMKKLTCPECKNDVNLDAYQPIKPEQTIECNHCGIMLMVLDVSPEGDIKVEITDEGK